MRILPRVFTIQSQCQPGTERKAKKHRKKGRRAAAATQKAGIQIFLLDYTREPVESP